MSRKSQNLIELLPSAYSPRNKNFTSTSKYPPSKRNRTPPAVY